MKKKTPKQELEKQAKLLWQHACFVRWGDRCEACGSRASTMHHFIPRSRNGLLRYEILNGVPLCQSDHYAIHFSHSPSVVHRLIERIRESRGVIWQVWIDKNERILGRSFNNIGWLKEQIEKLEDSC